MAKVKCPNCNYDIPYRVQLFLDKTIMHPRSNGRQQVNSTAPALQAPSPSLPGRMWQMFWRVPVKYEQDEVFTMKLTVNHKGSDLFPNIQLVDLSTVTPAMCQRFYFEYGGVNKRRLVTPDWSAVNNKRILRIGSNEHKRITEDFERAKFLECKTARQDGGCTLYEFTESGMVFLAQFK